MSSHHNRKNAEGTFQLERAFGISLLENPPSEGRLCPSIPQRPFDQNHHAAHPASAAERGNDDRNQIRLAYKRKGWIGNYENVFLSEEALRALVPGGENVFAVHCKQNSGGQYIDVGLSLRTPPKTGN